MFKVRNCEFDQRIPRQAWYSNIEIIGRRWNDTSTYFMIIFKVGLIGVYLLFECKWEFKKQDNECLTAIRHTYLLTKPDNFLLT